MSLPDFSAPAGLSQLESYLASRSYIDGYTPSQADVAVYDALKSAPASDKYPHVARWYSHITSYEKEHADLKGDKSKAAELLSAAGSSSKAAPAAAAAAEEDDDDDVDLFGSDDEEEDAERERIKAERVAEYNAKKAAKGPRAASKSLVTLDIKVWDDETDLKETEKFVRSYEKDGLVWGLSKIVPIGYGISKIQMTLVVEDEKVSLDELQEYMQEEGADFIQSTDVVAMAKL